MSRRLKPGIPDAVAAAGMGGVLFGLWQMYRPLAWILGGLVLLVVALALGKRETSR